MEINRPRIIKIAWMSGIYAGGGRKSTENNHGEWESIKKCVKIHIKVGK